MRHHLRDAEPSFRMHDSGALVDVAHLAKIATVAEAVPWLAIWMPTHDPFIVAQWRHERGRHFQSRPWR